MLDMLVVAVIVVHWALVRVVDLTAQPQATTQNNTKQDAGNN